MEVILLCCCYLVKSWKEMCFTLKVILNVRDCFIGPIYSRTCRVHCVVTESAASNQLYTTMAGVYLGLGRLGSCLGR